jgi:hypothetical protein
LEYFRRIVGEDNFNRIADVWSNSLTLIVIALIIIIPLRLIRATTKGRIVRALADDSATILTVGLVLSLTTRGVEGLVEAHYIKLLAQYTHEGVVVGVLVAIFLRTCKTLGAPAALAYIWAMLRRLWS